MCLTAILRASGAFDRWRNRVGEESSWGELQQAMDEVDRLAEGEPDVNYTRTLHSEHGTVGAYDWHFWVSYESKSIPKDRRPKIEWAFTRNDARDHASLRVTGDALSFLDDIYL